MCPEKIHPVPPEMEGGENTSPPSKNRHFCKQGKVDQCFWLPFMMKLLFAIFCYFVYLYILMFVCFPLVVILNLYDSCTNKSYPRIPEMKPFNDILIMLVCDD